ncbi:flavin reductase family protein [Derxia lacustris]|uniref:flavin reductase family protein n=1 Tax=Derxia lacustris TaxID=764842 RepID=UPI000A174604|nr:flavin reductase family protein [Derxia lacustris]
MNTPAPDLASYKKALASFPSGVTVVTTRTADGQPRGFTASSFTSVSLEPRLVLVCIARGAASFDAFAGAPRFAISVLADGQTEVSNLFASRQADRFGSCDWQDGRTGLPLIAGASAFFECLTHSTVEAGDHLILIGQVVEHGHAEPAPLAYCRGAYAALAALPRAA